MIRTFVAFCIVLTLPASAQLTTLVDDYAVSDLTGAYVYRPHVSVHPTDGSYLVCWGDDRYGASSAGRLAGIGDIFIARFSPTGASTLANSKVGGIQFGFFSEFSLYDSGPLLRSNGDMLVAYHVDARTTIESIKFDDVYFSAYSSAGTSLIVDRQLNMVGSGGSGYAYQPSIIPFGQDLLFIYRYYINDLYHIGGTLVNGTTGERSGDAFVIDNAVAGSRAVPSGASNGARTMIAWTDSRADAQGDIYLQAYSGGSASGTNKVVNTDAGSGYNQFPRVAMNASGQCVVVWLDARDHSGGDLYAQLYSNTGAAIGSNIKLTNSGSALWEYPPGVGMDGSGNFVVVWSDSVPGQTWRAKTRAFSAAGVAVTPILELTSPASPSLHPDVFVEPGGRVTYVWLDGRLDPEHGRIYAKRAQLSVTSAADVNEPQPQAFRVGQNFPNPFNGSTFIDYNLDVSGVVRIVVYDMLGRAVADLGTRSEGPGVHRVRWEAAAVPSGTYLCRISVEGSDGHMRQASVPVQYIR